MSPVHNALKFSAVTGAASANNCKEMQFQLLYKSSKKTIFNLERNNTYTAPDICNPPANTTPLAQTREMAARKEIPQKPFVHPVHHLWIYPEIRVGFSFLPQFWMAKVRTNQRCFTTKRKQLNKFSILYKKKKVSKHGIDAHRKNIQNSRKHWPISIFFTKLKEMTDLALYMEREKVSKHGIDAHTKKMISFKCSNFAFICICIIRQVQKRSSTPTHIQRIFATSFVDLTEIHIQYPQSPAILCMLHGQISIKASFANKLPTNSTPCFGVNF